MGSQDNVGRTKQAGYQIGARRTVDIPQETCWQLLISPGGQQIWLGAARIAVWEAGKEYTLPQGTRGEIRVFNPPTHLRLTWHPAGWERASTIQLRVVPKGSRSVIALHQEHLPGPVERGERKRDFHEILDRLQEFLSSYSVQE